MLKSAIDVAFKAVRASAKSALTAWRVTPNPTMVVAKTKVGSLVQTVALELRQRAIRREHLNLWKHRPVQPVGYITAMVPRPTLLNRFVEHVLSKLMSAIRVIKTYTFRLVALTGTGLYWLFSTLIQGPAVVVGGTCSRIWQAIVRFYYRLKARFKRSKIKGTNRFRKLASKADYRIRAAYILYRVTKHRVADAVQFYSKKLARMAWDKQAYFWWTALGAETWSLCS